MLPFAIGGIYKLPLPQIIPISMGDLLAYYATAFAIPGSFAVLYVTRRMEDLDKAKEKEEQKDKEIEEHKPHFTITLEKNGHYFNLIINGCGKGKYRDIYFYDNRICDIWTQDSYRYKLCFEMDHGRIQRLTNKVINIPDSLCDYDEEEFPQKFLIFCEDVKIGAMFSCTYALRNDCEKRYYCEESIEIVDWRNT